MPWKPEHNDVSISKNMKPTLICPPNRRRNMVISALVAWVNAHTYCRTARRWSEVSRCPKSSLVILTYRYRYLRYVLAGPAFRTLLSWSSSR